MLRALRADFLKIRLMKFCRPRGASPSLGLGLGGAPRNEKANQRPPEFAEFTNAVAKGFCLSLKRPWGH